MPADREREVGLIGGDLAELNRMVSGALNAGAHAESHMEVGAFICGMPEAL